MATGDQDRARKRIQSIQIGERLVGDLCPCYLIAEIGINHNGDPDLGMDLIRAAHIAGADAVKFQTWITEEIITHSVPMPEYQKNVPGVSNAQFDLIARYELSRDDLRDLAGYAREIGIEFLSTPEGPTCIGWLEDLDVPAYRDRVTGSRQSSRPEASLRPRGSPSLFLPVWPPWRRWRKR